MSLKVVPVSFREVKEYVNKNHRHHKSPQGHKFSVGVEHDGVMVGVGICGRPVSRHLDDGVTLEITRVCSDGTKNVCSKIYSSLVRAGKSLGYTRFITYTLETETGSSLRSCGFEKTHETKGESWNRPSRGRTDKHPTTKKTRWEYTK